PAARLSRRRREQDPARAVLEQRRRRLHLPARDRGSGLLMKRALFALLALLAFGSRAQAACTNRCDPVAACTSSAPCNWNASSTWSNGGGTPGTCAGAG